MFDKTARRHETYRRYHAPPPPARVVAGCLVFAAVAGVLFASRGSYVGAGIAGILIAGYVILSPLIGRATPTSGGVFGFASFLMVLITCERVYYGHEVGIVVFSVAAVWFGVLALLFRRPFGRGGVIR